MIYNGIDIIEIQRIRHTLDRFGERFLNRVYTAEERKLCGGKADTLAARFASKEAIMKLLGTGRRGVSWRDIETLAFPSGKPKVNLYGGARREAAELGIREIAVSLTHSREYAVASAVGDGKPESAP